MAQVDPTPEGHDSNKLWEDVYSKERVSRRVNTLPLNEPIHADKVRFVCISDTHNQLNEVIAKIHIPLGDVLLHFGDFSHTGKPEEVDKFNAELGKLPHPHKIVIAGNHDLGFDDGEQMDEYKNNTKARWRLANWGTPRGYERLTNCIYLQDSSTKVYGLTVYGSSWHPLQGFSFSRSRGPDIHKEWMKIPPAPFVDVLMTHTPPLGHSDSDSAANGNRWGDADLLNCVEKRIKPRVHVFGHIHEEPYATTNGTTLFINAACCTHRNVPRDPPMLFDLPLPAGITKNISTTTCVPAPKSCCCCPC